ncbi:MAG: beta-galactosidase [Candidatus Omnitrophica bacterium]|nr:beta-galactosidase [Candidatus Omnitrophota bacterium]
MKLFIRLELFFVTVTLLAGAAYAAELTFPESHAAGDGLTVTFGASNFAPGTSRENVEAFYKNASVDLWRNLGVTSWESYVRWSGFEPERGRWDFSMYDAECDILERHGLKWIPFLLIGMNYATPDWYQKSDKNCYYKCLEHNEYSGVQSIWNPDLRSQVKRVIPAFAEHYRDRRVIESVLLGITGDFGEAIYPVTGGGWTGDYHQHQGYWCGDPYAKADFRAWLKNRYKTTDRLSKVWGKSCDAFDEIEPFLLENAPSERAWLDFVEWYRGSMNDWIDLWMKTTREAFPNPA